MLVMVLIQACSSVKYSKTSDVQNKSTHYDPPGSTNTTNKQTSPPVKKLYSFNNGTVEFDSRFEGARLNDVRQQDSTRFTLIISPENSPINHSAWFAFAIRSEKEQTITCNLVYTDKYHRYIPKISSDQKLWRMCDTSEFRHKDLGASSATITIKVGREKLWVAGQEMITSRHFGEWIDTIGRLPFVSRETIGKSAEGRDIDAMTISEAPKKAEDGYVVLLCRQHPPEVPGTMAFFAFVEEICANTPTANAFRKRYSVTAVPCVNPDGVDNGHWRHNYYGVDLNRDWHSFNQPETQVVRDKFLQIKSNAEKRGKEIKFGIDFHSTNEDVFYIIPVDTTVSPNGEVLNTLQQRYQFSFKRVNAWLQGIQKLQPWYAMNIDPSPENLDTPSANRWMSKELMASSTTYEVGDTTDREVVKKIARTAARVMMEHLLAE